MPEFAIADVVGEAVPGTARGVVHSVFSRACNIETVGGPLLTLLSSEQGNLPRGIRLARPAEPFAGRIIAGRSVLIANRVLQIPDVELTVDFSYAALFRGTVAARAQPPSEAQARTALAALRATVIEHLPIQGIAPLLLGTPAFLSGLDQTIAARLAQALPRLTRATTERDFDGVIAVARELVGLGPGLTPSGDDFLVGYLAALWSRRREDGMEALLEALPARLASLLASGNAVSRQMLGDASLGRFPEVLVEVAQALDGAGDVAASALRALAIGDCSGADLLCGLLFGYGPQWAGRSAPVPERTAGAHPPADAATSGSAAADPD